MTRWAQSRLAGRNPGDPFVHARASAKGGAVARRSWLRNGRRSGYGGGRRGRRWISDAVARAVDSISTVGAAAGATHAQASSGTRQRSRAPGRRCEPGHELMMLSEKPSAGAPECPVVRFGTSLRYWIVPHHRWQGEQGPPVWGPPSPDRLRRQSLPVGQGALRSPYFGPFPPLLRA